MKLRRYDNGEYKYATFNYVTPQRRLQWLGVLRAILNGADPINAIQKVKGEQHDCDNTI